MHLTISIKWFDMWIGLFIDTKKQVIYFCPLPCIVIQVYWNILYLTYWNKSTKSIYYKKGNLTWLNNIFCKIKKEIK